MATLADATATAAAVPAVTPLVLYACGVFGSAAAELVAALNETVKLNGQCPPIYKKPFYVTVRVLVALVPAGGLPVLLAASNPWAAFYLGISAPLFLDRIQRGLDTGHAGAAPVATTGPTAAVAAKK